VLDAAAQKETALAFVRWLAGSGQAIFRQYFYDPPAGASPLRA
jgi:ABC-type molybdate transport system substrate-binding protein